MVSALWGRAAAQAQVGLAQVPTCAQSTVPGASFQSLAWGKVGSEAQRTRGRKVGAESQAPQS
jgi:hypothetical protein